MMPAYGQDGQRSDQANGEEQFGTGFIMDRYLPIAVIITRKNQEKS